MATKIKKRGKTRWRGNVQVDGQMRQKLFDTKSAAQAWEVEERTRATTQQTRMDSLTVHAWATEVLTFSKAHNATKTYKEKCSTFKRFIASVGAGLLVEQIKPSMALNFLEVQEEMRSGNSANVDRKNLSAAWAWGTTFIDHFPKTSNPFRRVPVFKHELQQRYVPPQDDFWRVVDAAEGQDRVMLTALLYLAARRSELFRLQWSDIDFNAGTVRLLTRKRKSKALEADWLPLADDLKRELLWWWEHRVHKSSAYVFTVTAAEAGTNQFEGEPFKERRHFMKRMCARAGVKFFGFHSIRHLSATALYHAGHSRALIQGVLRHQSAATTETYLRKLGLTETKDALDGLGRKEGRVLAFPTAGVVDRKAEGF